MVVDQADEDVCRLSLKYFEVLLWMARKKLTGFGDWRACASLLFQEYCSLVRPYVYDGPKQSLHNTTSKKTTEASLQLALPLAPPVVVLASLLALIVQLITNTKVLQSHSERQQEFHSSIPPVKRQKVIGLSVFAVTVDNSPRRTAAFLTIQRFIFHEKILQSTSAHPSSHNFFKKTTATVHTITAKHHGA